jgi:hypothetical protein
MAAPQATLLGLKGGSAEAQAAQHGVDVAERAAADAARQLRQLRGHRAALERDAARVASRAAELRASYSTTLAGVMRQAAAGLELERGMEELAALAAAADDVREHAQAAEEELRLLAEALGGQLTRAEQRAAAAPEAAATMSTGGAAAAPAAAATAPQAGAPTPSGLLSEADAILSGAEQLLAAAEAKAEPAVAAPEPPAQAQPQTSREAPMVPQGNLSRSLNALPQLQLQAVGVGVAERLLWVNKAADAMKQAMAAAGSATAAQASTAGAAAAAKASAAVESVAAAAVAAYAGAAEVATAKIVEAADAAAGARAEAQTAAANAAAVFQNIPETPDMASFLQDMVRASEAQPETDRRWAAAGLSPQQAAAAFQAAVAIRAADAPLVRWAAHWAAEPGWDAKAAWLQAWARQQLREGGRAAADAAEAAEARGQQAVGELRQRVAAAFTLVVGLSDALWPGEDEENWEQKGGGSSEGAAASGEEPLAQGEYGPDGLGRDKGGGDGGDGKGKGGGGGGGRGEGSGSDGGDGGDYSGGGGGGGGKPPGGGGGKGGPSDPWDGFDSFPPGRGMDPVVLLPVAFAAAVSLASALLNGKRSPAASAATSRAPTPDETASKSNTATAKAACRAEARGPPAGAATMAAGAAAAARDGAALLAGLAQAGPEPAAPAVGTLGALVAAFEAGQLIDASAEALRRQVADPAQEAPVAALGWAVAGTAESSVGEGGGHAPLEAMERAPDLLCPGALRGLSWEELDNLPAVAQQEVLALRDAAATAHIERSALRRALKHAERALAAKEGELAESQAQGAGIAAALEAALAEVRAQRRGVLASAANSSVLVLAAAMGATHAAS